MPVFHDGFPAEKLRSYLAYVSLTAQSAAGGLVITLKCITQSGVYNCKNKQEKYWNLWRFVSVHAQQIYTPSACIHIFILQKSFQQLILNPPLTLQVPQHFSNFQRQESHIP